jgi:hypothetical protein
VENTEQKTYRKAIVSYVDILGFKKLVEDSEHAPEKVAQIGELLQAAKDELRLPPPTLGGFQPIRSKNVLCSKLFRPHGPGAFC